MRFIFHGLFCIIICLQQGAIHAQKLSPGVKRILFLGNSITFQGNYINDMEAYFLTHYPERQLEFINVGLPSETVSGLSEHGHAGGSFPRPDLHERLERVLTLTKPDMVFACYGMNDGIYLPLDNDRFRKFKDGINWMHDEVVKTGARLVHLTPPAYDELKGGSIGYAAVLDRYSDWLLGLKSSAKWEVIDIHYPMKKYLEARRKGDIKFALAPDGVHPGEVGHWIIAREVLLYLGCKGAAKAPGVVESLPEATNGPQILQLVTKRQNMMRDAWLTVTRHNRPGLNKGLPLKYAQENSLEMDREIRALIQ